MTERYTVQRKLSRTKKKDSPRVKMGTLKQHLGVNEL